MIFSLFYHQKTKKSIFSICVNCFLQVTFVTFFKTVPFPGGQKAYIHGAYWRTPVFFTSVLTLPDRPRG